MLPFGLPGTCTNNELASFARTRHVQVGQPGSRRRLNKVDYVNALEQADKDFTFRFMDLAAELRVHIYRELLLFEPGPTARTSWTCYPHIMATSKTIHKEASPILYRENLIEVKIYSPGADHREQYLCAHGHPCGELIKLATWDEDRTGEWPNFLRRARWIKFSTNNGHYPDMQVNSILLYNFCSWLQEGHDLAIIEVEVGTTLQDIRAQPVTGTREEAEYRLLNPLQLLGELPLLKVISRDGAATELAKSVFPAIDQLKGGVLAPLQPLLEEYRTFESLTKLYYPQWPWRQGAPQDAPLALRSLVECLNEWLALKKQCAQSMLCTSAFECNVHSATAWLRGRLDLLDVSSLASTPPEKDPVRTAKIFEKLGKLRDIRKGVLTS
ncbi:hypothetical protein LTR56_023777 [Elasticomyces elasticus]|nr:hypothetical protein LTR56_023777 [Elasticomyces elasticus]KAK4912914.1 hypothetical protein LTR49_018664 [Elasticomyces elasticus]KAK5735713.1 hypothetical protein LTS12_026383 [Elasticomyces elasticus]